MTPAFKVNDVYAGKTVYAVLRREFKFSASLIRRLKHTDGFLVNKIPVFVNHILNEGDIVEADIMSAEPPCGIVPEDSPVDILFENEGLIAVNKPAGILVHPSHSKYTGTLANFVAGYLLRSEGCGVCHAVNRLDRDTSGVVLFAKNSYMKDLSAKALADDEAVKEYYAVVYGVFNPLSGVIDMPIRRLEEGNMMRIPSADGKCAVTRYETLSQASVGEDSVSVLKLVLLTGRTHQIRVHCLACGHPLLGDGLYYTAESDALSARLGISAQLLHAGSLTFREVLSSDLMTISAPVTREDMRKILE